MLRITVDAQPDRTEYVYFAYNQADKDAIEKLITDAGMVIDVLTLEDLINDGTESNTIEQAVANRAESLYEKIVKIADLDGAIAWYWPRNSESEKR